MVSVERAKAATRARNATWEDHTPAEFFDPVDFDEEDPRLYALQDADAGDFDPAIGDFRDYGDL